jgi:GDPmannose 4,6-dehydratase
MQDELVLGNLDAKRDWGYAPDYVRAMWLMLQQDEPKDYVIGTGETHSVQEFLDGAFRYAGLDPKKHVKIDPKFIRPSEVDTLRADPRKANTELGWHVTVGFEDLIKKMVDHDITLAATEMATT